MKSTIAFSSLASLLLPSLVAAQLSGTVGPTTSTASKAATKVCNILDYGGVASATTDNSAAIASAWAECKTGGEGICSWAGFFQHGVLFLSLNSLYSLWKLWSGGLGHSDRRNGCIHQPRWYHLPHRVCKACSLGKYVLLSLLSTAGGNMFFIEHTTDFEFYSSTSKGAIQGYGYVFHAGRSSTFISEQYEH